MAVAYTDSNSCKESRQLICEADIFRAVEEECQ